jgi:hypothetical protein
MADTKTTTGRQLSAHDRRRVAVEVPCSDRTVTRYLDGVDVGDMMRTRIEKALRKLGMDVVRAGAAS